MKDTVGIFKFKTGKRTRGHDFALMKGHSRLAVRKYSFFMRTVKEWNKLSADSVHSSGINMFKNRIDNYLARALDTLRLIRADSRKAKGFLFCSHQLFSVAWMAIL